jgi:hypothetical protein
MPDTRTIFDRPTEDRRGPAATGRLSGTTIGLFGVPDNHRPDNHRPDNHRPDNYRPDNYRNAETHAG